MPKRACHDLLIPVDREGLTVSLFLFGNFIARLQVFYMHTSCFQWFQPEHEQEQSKKKKKISLSKSISTVNPYNTESLNFFMQPPLFNLISHKFLCGKCNFYLEDSALMTQKGILYWCSKISVEGLLYSIFNSTWKFGTDIYILPNTPKSSEIGTYIWKSHDWAWDRFTKAQASHFSCIPCTWEPLFLGSQLYFLYATNRNN